MAERIAIVDMKDHLCDVCERDPVFTRVRAGTWPKHLFFRCVVGIAVRPDGKVLFLERRKDKTMYAGAWDYSVCGQVTWGETYHQAFARELWEELNVPPTTIRYRLIDRLLPAPEHGILWHTHLYRLSLTKTPDFNRDDFVEAHWLEREALGMLLTEWVKAPQTTSPRFRIDVERILRTFWASA